MKRILFYLLLLCCGTAFVACSDDNSEAKDIQVGADDLKEVALNKLSTRTIILRGGTGKYTANVADSKIAGVAISKDTLRISGILEGRTKIENMMESGSFSRNGANRILIASEDQAFVQEIIRNANILQFNQINTVLYCTSKVRAFDTIEIEHLHNTNARMSLGYYIDYDNPKVQAFLLAYRALFNTEPNQYAFVGYDTAYTLLKACSNYGDKWADMLCLERRRGLQSDFFFKHIPGGGYVNQAVRRIVHEPGYVTRLL